jgi:hypothetical protein
MSTPNTEEHNRLGDISDGWRLWGPYLSERAWGTVREDYSPDGSAWTYFPHDHARSRAYRWSEDGLAGISDVKQKLCFALALWNGRDPILKERPFGLTNPEGNHGEDVKEYYFYLDNTPTHSYMKMLYKYPQGAFPYDDLVQTNRTRTRHDPEYELVDTGIFADNLYFDITIEYAKAGPTDVLVRISATNRAGTPADLHILPTLWFRNTWSWGEKPELDEARPTMKKVAPGLVLVRHPLIDCYTLACEGVPDLLFTENESNVARLFGTENPRPYVKDSINDAIVHGQQDRVNPDQTGTKMSAHYSKTLDAGETWVVRLRLSSVPTADDYTPDDDPFDGFDATFDQRAREADEFYAAIQPPTLTDDERLVQRQALAGMLWSKQFYHYNVEEWLNGDPAQPPPPPERKHGRNSEWQNVFSDDIMSMPDTWEYPWFAAWDLAFHCLPLALVDAEFAKAQLLLLGREWYQHPNGQIPAYEWNFSDVNPPVLAWAAWRVYLMDKEQKGEGDLAFLERVFHKQLLDFTWWVNRKDAQGMNVFEGGFLGLDNIGVFDRNAPLPTGGWITQSDGTSWMAMFCLNMLTIALELATHDRVYEDIATKFFEHFLYIASAMNNIGGKGIPMWSEDDEFFYDVLHVPLGDERGAVNVPLKVRSLVGLIPLCAVTIMEQGLLEQLPDFNARLRWILEYQPEDAKLVSRWSEVGIGERRLVAILRGHRMKCLLKRMLDEGEFLSGYGVRSLSRYHLEHPYVFEQGEARYEVRYEPGESESDLYGGNSNWRGPVWFPVNYILIESLERFHSYYGDDFKVEYPTHSGQMLTLGAIAADLSRRLVSIFLRDQQGHRRVFGDQSLFQTDPHWRDYIQFSEYFHGETGAGLGASHQTGWTGLVAELIQQIGKSRVGGEDSMQASERAEAPVGRRPASENAGTPWGAGVAVGK